MAIYCKAFLARDLQRFPGWTQNEMSWRAQEQAPQEGADIILYLHENYVVTDGVMRTEKIVFDRVTPEWIEFCKGTLAFAIPGEDRLAQ